MTQKAKARRLKEPSKTPLRKTLVRHPRLRVKTPKAIRAIGRIPNAASAPAAPRRAVIAVDTNMRKEHLTKQVIAREVTDREGNGTITRVIKKMTFATAKDDRSAHREDHQKVMKRAGTRLEIGKTARSIV